MTITHDFHCHTHLSVCAQDSATIANYLPIWKALGITRIGIADHMWDENIPFADSFWHSRSAGPEGIGGTAVVNWYRAQFIPHCREILDEIAAQQGLEGLTILFGGEVDYAPGYGAAITVEEAEKLDFMVVPNSHTHHTMDTRNYEPYAKHGEFMVRAALDICTGPASDYVTSLAHPFKPVCCPYPDEYVIDAIPEHQFREVFCAAKEKGIGVEINTGCFPNLSREQIQNHWMFHVLSIAKSCGCCFTVGSDAHAPNDLYPLPQGALWAELLGLTEADLHPICLGTGKYAR